jgi:hypothetical protein
LELFWQCGIFCFAIVRHCTWTECSICTWNNQCNIFIICFVKIEQCDNYKGHNLLLHITKSIFPILLWLSFEIYNSKRHHSMCFQCTFSILWVQEVYHFVISLHENIIINTSYLNTFSRGNMLKLHIDFGSKLTNVSLLCLAMTFTNI